MSKLQNFTGSPPKSETGSNRSENYFLMIGNANRRKLQLKENCITDRMDAEDYEIYMSEVKDKEFEDKLMVLEE
jgi:hypothetical protein